MSVTWGATREPQELTIATELDGKSPEPSLFSVCLPTIFVDRVLGQRKMKK